MLANVPPDFLLVLFKKDKLCYVQNYAFNTDLDIQYSFKSASGKQIYEDIIS